MSGSGTTTSATGAFTALGIAIVVLLAIGLGAHLVARRRRSELSAAV